MNKTDINIQNLENFRLPRYKELPEIELYMDQVISTVEKHLAALKIGEKSLITPSMINNYVKNGVIPPPQKKRYTRDHLAAIIIICALKQTVEITDISRVLSKCNESRTMEQTFDIFAERYESKIASLIENYTGNELDTIVNNAILSSTSRIVVEHAMTSVFKSTDECEEKSKKKKSKTENDKEEISLLPVI